MSRAADSRDAAARVKKAIEVAWRAGPALVGDKEVARLIRAAIRELMSGEDLELLRECADGAASSYTYPKGTPDHKQPTEWHEARKLQQLTARLAAASGR